MKRIYILLCCIAFTTIIPAQQCQVFSPLIKTLQLKVNGDSFAPPIIGLQSEDIIEISFDELTHEYHNYTYTLSHCNADWAPSGLLEIDFLNGFNNNQIEDYQTSINTTMDYTHYRFHLPNNQLQLTASGNYILTVTDDDKPSVPVLKACFSVIEKQVSVSASVSSNTDIDTNASHQQVSFGVNFQGYNIRMPQNELKVQVLQNRRTDNMATNMQPSFIGPNQLKYEHIPSLIFEAGNEYRRFEIVNVHYPSQGVESIQFFPPYYHATLFPSESRTKNYSYDQDQNGQYVIRYDLAQDSEIEADYIFVHFSFPWNDPLTNGGLYLQGEFTYDRFNTDSRLLYNADARAYESVQLLKQGAYNYLYLYVADGSTTGSTSLVEGNFYETENDYLILIYHRPFGERYDRLIGMQQVRYTN